MSAVKKLQSSDYNEFLARCDDFSTQLLNDLSTAPDALKYAMSVLNDLIATYDPTDVSADRKAAWKAAKELKQSAAKEIPPMFPVGSSITGNVAREVLAVRGKIKQMDFTPKAEEEARDLINSLYLEQDSGIKKIESGHQIMNDLWSEYYAVQLKNSDRYASGVNRRPERDAQIKAKLLRNKDKFNQELLATVLSKLDQ